MNNKSSTTNESSTTKGVVSLFPTPVMKVNINRSFTESEMQCIVNIPLEKKNKDGAIMSNHRSESYYLFGDSPNLKDIKRICELELKRYLKNVEGADTDKVNLKITQSWLNKIKPQEFQQLHTHPNSYISGVLYISCLPNDSIVFTDRNHGSFNNIEFPIEESTFWNCWHCGIPVKEGDLVIFPSWIMHHVEMNDTKDKERISLAFNTFPIGE
ncbi:uncharacterized protein METZ01_LOCUS433529, partial [marine metagenome]